MKGKIEEEKRYPNKEVVKNKMTNQHAGVKTTT
jgi:hypothetical protein